MKIELSDLTVVMDTREPKSHPWDMAPMRVRREKLCTGDLSVVGFQNLIRLERKECSDFIACIGRDRDRFERELVRLRGFKHKAVIIECNWQDILDGNYRSKTSPLAVRRSISAWTTRYGVPFYFRGTPQGCALAAQDLLLDCAREVIRFASNYAHMVKRGAEHG